MQCFCHTAAYPKPVDVRTHHTLPDFIMNRGGVSLRPGDGIIHSWLNRMLLPDTVGTGGDSHTRFPIGISFPAGSGLVAFAAATGVMPLDMPESVLVRFTGTMQPGITLRDLVHAIPYEAKQRGLLTVEKQGKVNVFSGRILEIEVGRPEPDPNPSARTRPPYQPRPGARHLKCEQAFELSDASAERSAAGCTIKLRHEPIGEYLSSNVDDAQVDDRRGLRRPAHDGAAHRQHGAWLATPALLEADPDASYHATIDIDMDEITEPIVCCPNDPDDAKLLSEVAGDSIDEVFIGSCMTNIGHFRAAGKLLDSMGAERCPRGCGSRRPPRWTQRSSRPRATTRSTARWARAPRCPAARSAWATRRASPTRPRSSRRRTRNFPNRLGKGANVYLASAELAAVAAIEGKLPTPEVYLEAWKKIDSKAEATYQYINFDTMAEYTDKAQTVSLSDDIVQAAKKAATM